MTDERRYEEDEVAQIFEEAATARGSQARALSPAGGLSLAELKAIGGEVGIAPERIADAAAAVDLRRGAAPRRTHLGLPIAVGRTVDLPRAPTDREWEMLVAELRETFAARGRDTSTGGFRAWNNGKLHAYVEPTEGGYRLRLGTVKTNAAAVGRLGVAGAVAGVALLGVILGTGGPVDDMGLAALITAVGSGFLGINAVRLPRWASERERQMEHIAARAQALVRADPEPRAIGEGA
ncbi:MAG TPA: hypothetical protein VFE05_04135 [Longimicrobiaceae bacterium]|jgi:hypothetical protein|nr:hypothetical protein [Longimicrobiaceae bacterium]